METEPRLRTQTHLSRPKAWMPLHPRSGAYAAGSSTASPSTAPQAEAPDGPLQDRSGRVRSRSLGGGGAAGAPLPRHAQQGSNGTSRDPLPPPPLENGPAPAPSRRPGTVPYRTVPCRALPAHRDPPAQRRGSATRRQDSNAARAARPMPTTAAAAPSPIRPSAQPAPAPLLEAPGGCTCADSLRAALPAVGLGQAAGPGGVQNVGVLSAGGLKPACPRSERGATCSGRLAPPQAFILRWRQREVPLKEREGGWTPRGKPR